MKKIALIICSFFAITYFSACSNNDAAKVDLTEFNKYVDSVDNLKPVYTVANWTEIEQGYAAKENNVEKVAAVAPIYESVANAQQEIFSVAEPMVQEKSIEERAAEFGMTVDDFLAAQKVCSLENPCECEMCGS